MLPNYKHINKRKTQSIIDTRDSESEWLQTLVKILKIIYTVNNVFITQLLPAIPNDGTTC